MITQPPPLDQARLQAFMGRAVGDFGSTISSALVVIGDRLGLYRALAGAGPLSARELARRTSTDERYVSDWLVNQAAGGYLDYDAESGGFTLPAEHALALADEDSPFFVAGGFLNLTSIMRAQPRITEAFRTGSGMPWGDHDPGVFEGTERFFRPGYVANLVGSWIPALDGVEARLRAGATVADVGCGHGASTIILAEAYPQSRFFGFDDHARSIERARAAAAQAGVEDRVVFEVAGAADFPGAGYDLIACFDCFHDLGDPLGAARHARRTLAADGTLLLVEPFAGSRVEDNLNPVGRIFSAASVLICTPNALASGADAGTVLGPLATDEQLAAVTASAGFSRFRRATETAFNRVLEVRP